MLQQMLNDYRGDLHTAALPEELVAASGPTVDFLKSQSARVTLEDAEQGQAKLSLEVRVGARRSAVVPASADGNY